MEGDDGFLIRLAELALGKIMEFERHFLNLVHQDRGEIGVERRGIFEFVIFGRYPIIVVIDLERGEARDLREDEESHDQRVHGGLSRSDDDAPIVQTDPAATTAWG